LSNLSKRSRRQDKGKKSNFSKKERVRGDSAKKEDRGGGRGGKWRGGRIFVVNVWRGWLFELPAGAGKVKQRSRRETIIDTEGEKGPSKARCLPAPTDKAAVLA